MLQKTKIIQLLIGIIIILSAGCSVTDLDGSVISEANKSEDGLSFQNESGINLNINNSFVFIGELWPDRTLYYFDQNITVPDHKMKFGFALSTLRYISGLKTVKRSGSESKTLQIRHVKGANPDVTRGNISSPHMILDFDTLNTVQVMKYLMKALGIVPTDMNLPNLTDYNNVMYYYSNPANYIRFEDVKDRNKIITDAIYQNRLTFMAETYLMRYIDLTDAFGNNQQEALKHWKKFGLRERPSRLSSLIMDVNYYKNHYRVYPSGEPESTLCNQIHIVNYLFGHKNQNYTIVNGARASRMFDPVWYVNKYPDLKKAFSSNHFGQLKPDYILAAFHFVHHGLAEGRQSAADFDIRSYIKRYPAINDIYGEKAGRPADYTGAMNHYLRYGINLKLNPAPL